MNSNPIKTALIVGGGIAGMSAAIVLSRLGVSVTLAEIDPKWRAYGAGITIAGATLRAFEALGILPELASKAYLGQGIQVCDPKGTPLKVLPTHPVAPHLAGCGGIMRPLLHEVLSKHTLAQGTKVLLGVSIHSVKFKAQKAQVCLTDGSEGDFDLVIGADGLNSRLRQMLFPEAPEPAYLGQSVWRIVVERPAHITMRHFFLGGPVKVGLTPVSKDQMYMFLLETCDRKPILEEPELEVQLRQLLSGYSGILDGIVDRRLPGSSIVLRPLEGFLMPAPWHIGNALLIGDAAHPTTPQLASGAGMAIEDALVLGEELQQAKSVNDLFARYMARRYARCRLVVENSLEIGRREQRRAPIEEQTRLVEESLQELANPI